MGYPSTHAEQTRAVVYTDTVHHIQHRLATPAGQVQSASRVNLRYLTLTSSQIETQWSYLGYPGSIPRRSPHWYHAGINHFSRYQPAAKGSLVMPKLRVNTPPLWIIEFLPDPGELARAILEREAALTPLSLRPALD